MNRDALPPLEQGTVLHAALAERVEDALREARESGASDAEARLSLSRGWSVRVRQGKAERVEHDNGQGFAITVYFGRRKGSASSTDVDPASIHQTVRTACTIARESAEDPHAGLPDIDWLAREAPDLDLLHPWDISVSEGVERARACEAAGLAQPGVSNSHGAGFGTSQSRFVYGNTRGFLGGYPGSWHSLSCALVAGEGLNMQRDSHSHGTRVAGELPAAEEIGREAARRTLARLNPRPIASGRYPVLFTPEVARGLLSHLTGAVSGGALYRRASFLLDALGTRLFPEDVRITERPHLPRGPASAPFDGEGVATRERDLVNGGVLQGYLLDSYSARRLGQASTGHAGGVRNLEILPTTEEGHAALLRRMSRGLVVTEVMGQGVNTVTGDYSRGAAGFWVEGGEVRHAVNEITIASNLRDMFGGLLAAGADSDRRGGIVSGSWLVDAMTVASRT
jgi:PmbA protein